jgi:protein-disulfide isomerase
MLRHQDKKPVQFFLLTNFIGFVVGLYTLWHHVSINTNALERASFCNVSSYINCDAVALSPYSAVFGYPVAGLLVIFYGVLMMLGLALYFAEFGASKPAKDENELHKLRSSIFVLSSFALVPTAALGLISVFVLKLLCLLCLTSYLINVVIWFFALRFYRRNPKTEGIHVLPPKTSRISAGIVAAVLALSPFMIKGIVGGGDIDDNVLNSALYSHFSQAPMTISTEGSPSFGPADAKVTVVEYSDFQCPHCARASTVVPQVVRAFSQVRFVFKNFPLDPNCNPTMQGRGHPLACLAAKTGHCVFTSKGSEAFFAYEKSVFAKQAELSAPLIEEIALSGGLSKDALKTCVESPEVHAVMVAQSEEGKAIGVTGTPAIYVNGRKLDYGSVAKVLKTVIERYSENTSNAGK